MSSKNKNNVRDMLERLKASLGSHVSDADLARLLKIHQNNITNWKSRNKVNYQKIIDLCREKGIDATYVFLGSKNLFENERRIRMELGLEPGGPQAPLAWAPAAEAPAERLPQDLAAAHREIELLRALLVEKDKIIRLLEESQNKETDE